MLRYSQPMMWGERETLDEELERATTEYMARVQAGCKHAQSSCQSSADCPCYCRICVLERRLRA
jgi:hypothetical protein